MCLKYPRHKILVEASFALFPINSTPLRARRGYMLDQKYLGYLKLPELESRGRSRMLCVTLDDLIIFQRSNVKSL